MASTIPPEYLCPISCDIMEDPVSDDNGHTYDRKWIEEVLLRKPNESPITRTYISHNLRTNYSLKSQIERFKQLNPTAAVIENAKEFVSNPCVLDAGITTIRGARHVSITITPPADGARQPIAMILLLDNSGSMGENACEVTETGGVGFTRMDLSKHTIRTLAGMLNENDTLAIITFSTSAHLVMKPTRMSESGKELVDSILKRVNPDSQTNIYSALELSNQLTKSAQFTGAHIVTALLTDGLPNVNPALGIVPTYKTLIKTDTLSTFGFGYQLDSAILAELAKEGGGMFGFIPDYSMVSTVFINWAAAALATAALSRKVVVNFTDGSSTSFMTGNIQFGQPRHFIFPNERTIVNITMDSHTVVPNAEAVLPTILALRHDMRVAIQSCISANGLIAPDCFTAIRMRYSAAAVDDASVNALLQDISENVEEGQCGGQVALAPRFYQKWGKHYLRAYRTALENEICMNFKDPGLQIFGGALFKTIQTEGAAVFNSIPPMDPTGSRSPAIMGGSAATSPVAAAAAAAPSFNMSMFYQSSGGCFLGYCNVWMENGSSKKLQELKPGDRVMSFGGSDTVIALVKCTTQNKYQDICYLGDLAITPWHPILLNGEWVFPANETATEIVETHTVYNVVLEKDHIMNVGGKYCVTLGHGFTESVVAHPYFGTQRVIEDLKKCKGWSEGLPTYTNLVARRDSAGLVCEWIDSE